MIKGFCETSPAEWPGKDCATVFLPYCNLRCPYCDTHRLVLHPDALNTWQLADILATLQTQKDRIAGICISGGEPTIHRDLPGTLKAARETGLETKLETNGTQPEVLEHLIANHLVDFVAMDVKAPLDDASYERCAGVYVPVEIIKKSLAVLAGSAGVSTVLRCTACPSLLEPEQVKRVAEDIRRLWSDGAEAASFPPLILQEFISDDPLSPSLKGTPPYSAEALSRMQAEVDAILS